MLKKPITLNDYFENNPNLKDNIMNIVEKCGNPNGCSLESYIITNEATTLIYSNFFRRQNTYAVVAIYTDVKMRNVGSATKLLKNLPSLGSLYFDTYSEPLANLLKKIGAYEEEVFLNKPSKQFILDT